MVLQKNREKVALLAIWTCLLATIGAVQANGLGANNKAPVVFEAIHDVSKDKGQTVSTPNSDVYSARLSTPESPGPLQAGIGYSRFDHIIRRAARTFEVDFYLIKAIIKAESRFDPRAVSNRGACGLMQLMPLTARAMGVKNIFDPRENIFAGVKYYKQLLDTFRGNDRLALAAYNAGITIVKKYGGVPPFPVTKVYLTKVFSYAKEFKAS